MILRKVVGSTMAEALERVRKEVGPDAIIVETSFAGGVATVIAKREANRAQEAPHNPWKGTPFIPEAIEPKLVLPEGFRPFAECMAEFGISQKLIKILLRAVKGLDPHLLKKGNPSLQGVLRRVLAGLIPTAGTGGTSLGGQPTQPSKVIALVGPTGVGKTTTLAKLAAQSTIHQDLSVGIISTDTFRIAAVEQLRAFAEMMGAPFRVAFTPQDLRATLREFQHKDRIFIDTTGRSPKDAASLKAMRGFLADMPIEVHLCLSAGTRRRDLIATLRAFEPFEPRYLTLTKWDETLAPGEALSLAIERNLPLSWITNGQNVPEDLLPAEGTILAEAAIQETANA
jgi:flagellar biosynthesis protein FlhF